jgi:P pilus assembly chaperone PapD
MSHLCRTPARLIPALLCAAAIASPAHAGLMLSKVIIDLGPDAPARDDIELFNDGAERLFVVAEPSEIIDPGLATEQRKPSPDPAVTGLLVSPQKLVLEPGERKLVRIAAVAARPAHDRVYRVTIKPVAGPVSADQTALKVYVGYDALVLFRPAQIQTEVAGTRQDNQITLRNRGNSNVELANGKQCDDAGADCQDLPSNRLYPGQDWVVSLPHGKAKTTWRLYSGGKQTEMSF